MAQLAGLIAEFGDRFPEANQKSKQILEDLILKNPGNRALQSQLAFLEFQQDPLGGILFARNLGLSETLAVLLHLYKSRGLINDDILRLTKTGYLELIASDLELDAIAGETYVALELVKTYEGESGVDQFVDQARASIPWSAWNQKFRQMIGELGLIDTSEARRLLSIYCQATMLRLDEGRFCSLSVESITSVGGSDHSDTREMSTAATWAKAQIEDSKITGLESTIEVLGAWADMGAEANVEN
jgi:hypothetical protein